MSPATLYTITADFLAVSHLFIPGNLVSFCKEGHVCDPPWESLVVDKLLFMQCHLNIPLSCVLHLSAATLMSVEVKNTKS